MADQPKKKRSFLIIYVAGLLTIALLLVTLSYFQQRRANEELSTLREQQENFSVEALQSIGDLRGALAEMQDRNAELETEIGALESEVDSLNAAASALRSEKAEMSIEAIKLEQQIKELSGELARSKALAESYEALLNALEPTGAVVVERDENGNVLGYSIAE